MRLYDVFVAIAELSAAIFVVGRIVILEFRVAVSFDTIGQRRHRHSCLLGVVSDDWLMG